MDAFHRLLHLALPLLLSCGLVQSQLDFFVNSGGEEEEETTQAPFLTLDVEVQEEVPNGDLHDVPNGDLHDAPNGDTDETEHASEVGEPLAENATSEEGGAPEQPTMEGDEEESESPVEVEGSQESGGEESTTLLPVLNFGYIDPSELLGEQVTPVLFELSNLPTAIELDLHSNANDHQPELICLRSELVRAF